ncbi:MAG: ABC transporter ATP-binding protein, partial [Clostridia bacterium]|nr:ABC transporter ATP-binding protein [Clostridia bacterium]
MIRKIFAQVKQYKRATILTPLCAALEVLMEVLIPFTTASLIDKGIQAGNMGEIWKYGLLMMGLALMSLLFGVLAAWLAARASSGFAANLRDAMYTNIQTFSFSNIDKFSTAGLVTRMTTDVSNIQNAFQMILRIAVRAPLTLITSMVMCFVINHRLSLIFLGAVAVLALALGLIIRKATKLFDQVFHRYDDLNASVQENVTAIRVVKAFVREEHEESKFNRAAENVYRLFVKAESIIAFNGPVMMLVVYGCIIALSWFGAQ